MIAGESASADKKAAAAYPGSLKELLLKQDTHPSKQ